MDEPLEEKKPFEVEAPTEEDAQPDPDEELMLDKGGGRVWLVKVLTHGHHWQSQRYI